MHFIDLAIDVKSALLHEWNSTLPKRLKLHAQLGSKTEQKGKGFPHQVNQILLDGIQKLFCGSVTVYRVQKLDEKCAANNEEGRPLKRI